MERRGTNEEEDESINTTLVYIITTQIGHASRPQTPHRLHPRLLPKTAGRLNTQERASATPTASDLTGASWTVRNMSAGDVTGISSAMTGSSWTVYVTGISSAVTGGSRVQIMTPDSLSGTRGQLNRAVTGAN